MGNALAGSLFLSMTSPTPVNYSIFAPAAGVSRSGFIQANTLNTVGLPISLQTSAGISNDGILVTSSEDMTVYGLNQVPGSTDGFLALPTNIQGHEYVIGSYTQLSFLGTVFPSQLSVAGIHDDTSVTVHLSSDANDGFQLLVSGQTKSYVINRLETLTISGVDLTGTRVFSDKTISVFGGHRCAFVPDSAHYCDHLVEQMPPVTTLGSHFATVPLATRTGGDVFRIVAYRDDTNVHINGVLQASALKAGQYHEFNASSLSFLFVEASIPILLLQYSKGSNADGVTSDPFMMMIPPIEQYRSRYLVSTPAAEVMAFSNYLGIVVPCNGVDGLRLDDAPLPSTIVWNNIPGQTLVGAAFPVTIGIHTLYHIARAKFGLTSYGFARFMSYGYPGGLQLNTAECTIDPPTTGDTRVYLLLLQCNRCVNSPPRWYSYRRMY